MEYSFAIPNPKGSLPSAVPRAACWAAWLVPRVSSALSTDLGCLTVVVGPSCPMESASNIRLLIAMKPGTAFGPAWRVSSRSTSPPTYFLMEADVAPQRPPGRRRNLLTMSAPTEDAAPQLSCVRGPWQPRPLELPSEAVHTRLDIRGLAGLLDHELDAAPGVFYRYHAGAFCRMHQGVSDQDAVDPALLFKAAGLPSDWRDENNDAQFTDFLEGNFLNEQVESIKQISDHVTNLWRVGAGLGEHLFDKQTLGGGEQLKIDGL